MRNSIPQSRFFKWLSGFAFLAVLAAGVAVAPARLQAQEALKAGVAAATQGTPTANAPKPEVTQNESKGEEKGEEVYLHAPVVKTLARLMHVSLETADAIFLFINFAIIVLAVGIPLVRILPKVIRKRTETLRDSIESARKVTEDANTRLSAVEAKLLKLDEEIAKFRSEVEQEMAQDEARIKAALEEESARIVASAEQEISVAATHARRGLRNFAASLAIEQAAKQMVLTPETDKALIAEFVSGVNGGNKGGQN